MRSPRHSNADVSNYRGHLLRCPSFGGQSVHPLIFPLERTVSAPRLLWLSCNGCDKSVSGKYPTAQHKPLGYGLNANTILLEQNMLRIKVSPLLYVVHQSEQPRPSYTCQSASVGVTAPPYENRFAHYVIFRNEAPVA